MKHKKILVLLLLFCMLFVSVSCKAPNNDNAGTNSDDSTPDQLLASELSDYVVIIPEKLSADERTAVNTLVKSVQKDFKIILNVKIDDLNEPVAKEILIGSTNRSQTETVSKMIRYSEYYVGFSEGKLVILGSNAEDTVDAIEYFTDLISQRTTAAVLFDGQKDLYYAKATFEVEDLSINGVSLSEYTILYADANTRREKRFAELIQEVIVKKSGIQVPIQSDQKAAYGNVLLVGKTSNQVGLGASENVVEIRGKTENDLFFAVQTLVRRLSASQTGAIEVGVSEPLSYTTADLNLSAYGLTPDRISLMSYNTQNAGNDPYDYSKFEKLANMIDLKDPDFVCLQECVAGSGAANSICNKYNKMENHDDYRVLNSDTTSETATSTNAIIYNATKYTLLSSGSIQLGKKDDSDGSLYDRYFLWAKVKSKLTNAVFIVICIHVDYVIPAGNAQFARMLTYVKEHFEGLPVLVAGDFNLTKPQSAFDYLEKQGFQDTHETAQRLVNGNEATFPEKGKERNLDFIYERGFSSDYFEVMTQTVNPSDHRPIYSECYIDLSK